MSYIGTLSLPLIIARHHSLAYKQTAAAPHSSRACHITAAIGLNTATSCRRQTPRARRQPFLGNNIIIRISATSSALCALPSRGRNTAGHGAICSMTPASVRRFIGTSVSPHIIITRVCVRGAALSRYALWPRVQNIFARQRTAPRVPYYAKPVSRRHSLRIGSNAWRALPANHCLPAEHTATSILFCSCLL